MKLVSIDFSLARHIVMEEGIVDLDNWDVSLHNPRTKYRSTLGRLPWTTDDLSSMYSSTCAEGVNCRGLFFPLDKG